MITHKPKSFLPLASALTAISCALLVSGPAAAQDSGRVTVDVARCLELESEAERSDCFAAEVNEVLETPAAPAAGRAAARDSEATGDERPARQERRPARDSEPAEDTETGEIFATIVTIEERLPSAYIITLDNGQVWEQTEPKRYPLRPGLEVRVYPTRWGNRYRLTGIDSGGHIQVRRLR